MSLDSVVQRSWRQRREPSLVHRTVRGWQGGLSPQSQQQEVLSTCAGLLFYTPRAQTTAPRCSVLTAAAGPQKAHTDPSSPTHNRPARSTVPFGNDTKAAFRETISGFWVDDDYSIVICFMLSLPCSGQCSKCFSHIRFFTLRQCAKAWHCVPRAAAEETRVQRAGLGLGLRDLSPNRALQQRVTVPPPVPLSAWKANRHQSWTPSVLFPPTGFIPPPLIFGAGIDSTCLFWSTFCGERGACVLYDNVVYRYLYVSIAIALKSFAFILYTTTWQCLRKNYKRYIKNHEGGLSTSEFFASTLTLDNLGRDPVPANQTHRTKFIYNLEDHEWCENMESVL